MSGKFNHEKAKDVENDSRKLTENPAIRTGLHPRDQKTCDFGKNPITLTKSQKSQNHKLSITITTKGQVEK